jgi:AmiR/NasT family two-component response regulator
VSSAALRPQVMTQGACQWRRVDARLDRSLQEGSRLPSRDLVDPSRPSTDSSPMTRAIVASSSTSGTADLRVDLEAVGVHVLGASTLRELVQQAIRDAPDVIVVFEPSPDESLFTALAAVLDNAPLPVVVFTQNPDADQIERAMRMGIHAWVVNGYGINRLRPVLALAQSRFRHESSLRTELAEANRRFEERKLVDRAKGILMRARQLSEEEAFRMLRTVSMQTNRRVGQVSQQVIDSARYAEAVNRAGQLRMLSQRLVKLQALAAGESWSSRDAALAVESSERIEANIEALRKALSSATFGDLIEGASMAWNELKAEQGRAGPEAQRLSRIDALADALLAAAERLTHALENAGLATTLHVINVSGRQRMLSQRLAKSMLLGTLLGGASATEAREQGLRDAAAFEEALDYLNGIPLSTSEIKESLGRITHAWAGLKLALWRVQTPEGKRAVVDASEMLLDLFEQLTGQYERSMTMLMG